MQTSISLQDMYQYKIFIAFVLIFIVLYITYYLITHKANDYKKIVNNEVKEIPEKNIKNLKIIKGKYISQLESIEYKYKNQMIELRKAYQLISETIRMFVFEITDITTQNYSLLEIKKLNIPVLYDLIEEFYEPEFASKPSGDFENSLIKARSVINKWN